jgi:hypothetical protein
MLKKAVFILFFIFGTCFLSHPVLAYNDWIMETDNHSATFTGTWGTSTARILYYGDDYRWALCSGATGTVTATAKFVARTTVDVDGYYSVFARWVVDPNRSTAAPYYIYKDDNALAPITFVTRNQETLGGEWRLLGTYFHNTGDRPMVILQNNCAPEGNGANVIADAVRWVKENIDAGDIVDESGISYSKYTDKVVIASTNTAAPTTLRSDSVTCPAAGRVMALFTAEVSFYPTANWAWATVLYSLSTSTAWDTNNVQSIAAYLASTAWWERRAVVIQRFDSCSAGQSLTYRALAARGVTTNGNSYAWQPALSLIYFPTFY